MRNIEDKDLVGKTIKSIDATSVNSLVLFFEDDTSLCLTADVALLTQYGNIPGLFVSED